jgi:hypothetical protein
MLGYGTFSVNVGSSEWVAIKLSDAAVKLLDAMPGRRLHVTANGTTVGGVSVVGSTTLIGPKARGGRH